MFQFLKRILRSEGGWMAMIPMAISLASSIFGSMNKKKSLGASGVEMGYREQGQAFGDRMRGEQAGIIDPVREQAMPGLASALPDVYSQRPNSAEYEAIARQEQNLKNEALNTGARGGLLKKQMFEAAKNAASNKLNVMENARQNALQRAFQTMLPMMPTTGSDIAKEQIGNNMGQFMVETELKRKLPQQAAAQQDSAGAGSGLGSILGGLDLSKIFGGGGSPTGTAGTSNPGFGLGTSIMGSGGWGGFGSSS